MKTRTLRAVAILLACVPLGAVGLTAVSCGSIQPAGAGSSQPADSALAVVAGTSYLADMARQVAGDRLVVESLLPLGADPHSFDPTPRDAAKVAKARAVIVNSPGFEPAVDKLVAGVGNKDLLPIDAAKGLAGEGVDPHFWLDPLDVVTYVENIRDGLTTIDPAGAAIYAENAAAYSKQLRELDSWIRAQVATIPASRRLLVTNHESFGHFADRYGFRVVGTLVPTSDVQAEPSARALGTLIDSIRATGAPAIFLETGANPDLADQVAREAEVKVVTDLFTHSLGKDAPTYVDMMKWNVERIVEALR
jgi:ABC-type Zn uptake system ZnuABC Zn-binding protein ZnuA